ncbi:hypothetical protein QUC31_019216, partial [Theobroma cacao]
MISMNRALAAEQVKCGGPGLQVFWRCFVMHACFPVYHKWLLQLLLQISPDLWRKIEETIFKMRNISVQISFRAQVERSTRYDLHISRWTVGIGDFMVVAECV